MDVHVYLYYLEGSVCACREGGSRVIWLGRDIDEAAMRFEKLFQLPVAMIDWLRPGEAVMIWVPVSIADAAFGREGNNVRQDHSR